MRMVGRNEKRVFCCALFYSFGGLFLDWVGERDSLISV